MKTDSATGGGPPGAATVPLTEHFTRFIMVLRADPPDPASPIAALEKVQVALRSGPSPLWVSLDEAKQGQLVDFVLPWVRSYLRGEVPPGALRRERDCVAFEWDNDVVASRGRRLEATVRRNRSVAFSITACEAYVFSTGIVVCAVECELEGTGDNPVATDDLAEFNYYMSRLEPHQAPRIRKASGAHADDDVKPSSGFLSGLTSDAGMTFEEIIRAALGSVSPACRLEVLDERALRALTYARVPKGYDLDSLGEACYQLRRVVKSSYPPAPDDLLLSGHPDVVRTFDSVVIGFSLEGLAVLVADTGHPFYNDMRTRVRRSYFAHYLLALHQRSALLVLALAAGKLPRIRREDTALSEALFEQIADLRLLAVDFNLHHRFSQASTMTNYAQVYERLNVTLGIPALLEEVRDEITELDQVLGIRRREIEKARLAAETAERERLAREEAVRDRRLSQFIAVLGPLSLLLSVFGTNLPHYASMRPGAYARPEFWIPVSVWALLTGALWWVARRKVTGRA